jgi:nitrate/nitrite transporter NarK
MGTAGGFINMVGQLAALVSPLVIGYLVQTSKGGFVSSCIFLIGTALVSCAIMLTLKNKQPVKKYQKSSMTLK